MKPVQQPRPALPQAESRQVAVRQAGPMPDTCTRCGAALGDESPPEGKTCASCGHLNSHASLGADY